MRIRHDPDCTDILMQMLQQHQEWIEDVVIRLLCVFALDRFGDFVSDEVGLFVYPQILLNIFVLEFFHSFLHSLTSFTERFSNLHSRNLQAV